MLDFVTSHKLNPLGRKSQVLALTVIRSTRQNMVGFAYILSRNLIYRVEYDRLRYWAKTRSIEQKTLGLNLLCGICTTKALLLGRNLHHMTEIIKF
jgi:hypothetical protein